MLNEWARKDALLIKCNMVILIIMLSTISVIKPSSIRIFLRIYKKYMYIVHNVVSVVWTLVHENIEGKHLYKWATVIHYPSYHIICDMHFLIVTSLLCLYITKIEMRKTTKSFWRKFFSAAFIHALSMIKYWIQFFYFCRQFQLPPIVI